MSYCVMPGLDPGIHAFFPRQTDVDGPAMTAGKQTSANHESPYAIALPLHGPPAGPARSAGPNRKSELYIFRFSEINAMVSPSRLT